MRRAWSESNLDAEPGRSYDIAFGNSGAGKTHMALGLGLAACQKGLSVGFTTAAALVNELHEAPDEKRRWGFGRSVFSAKIVVVETVDQ
jgi:DNA replication protein DnaC